MDNQNQEQPSQPAQPQATGVPVASKPESAKADNYEYASAGSRALAVSIDLLVTGGFYTLILIPFFLMDDDSLVSMISSVLGIAVSIYYIYFIGKSGQTLGKKVMKIKVIKIKTNEHPDYVGSFLREVVGKFVSGLVFGLGYLWIIWDDKKQGWHDKIAGTVVVKVNSNA